MSLRIPGKTILVINSAKVASDLVDKRGLTWSDRPVFPLFDLSVLTSFWRLVAGTHECSMRLQDGPLLVERRLEAAYKRAPS